MEQIGVWTDHTITDENRGRVGKQYGLHDLQLRALDSHHRMPQALESDNWLVVNFLLPYVERGTLKTDKLSVLMNSSQIVTIHQGDDTVTPAVRERLELIPKVSLSPTGVLAVIADVVTELFTPVLNYVDTAVDDIEDVMIKQPTDKQLHQLFHNKKLLVDLRRVVLPTTALLDAMSDGRYALVDKKYAMYLRDSYDYSWRSHELIDTLRDLLTSALDTYLSVVSNRMNDVMKRLTMVATIFMPISFLVGFGGMNFVEQIPFGSTIFFWTLLACIIGVPVIMVMYFRKKKWL